LIIRPGLPIWSIGTNIFKEEGEESMSKKAILALLITVAIPVTSYLIVKYASADAVNMPRRYFYDSVVEKTIQGKRVSDTSWHKISNFQFTNQLGQLVNADSLHRKILVVDSLPYTNKEYEKDAGCIFKNRFIGSFYFFYS
jgi:hypothetical protein